MDKFFQIGQEIWWWDEVHLELHKGKIDKPLYGNWVHDYRWQVETTDDCDSDGRPFHLCIAAPDIYANLDEARLKLTRMLYDKAKAAVAEAKKFDEAHLKLLRL